ncbi:MAG: anaerobic ribonucleoside-triphosphate reductase activating protein [Candidatus Gracilibacteria bacterium]|nr:anaerobic ribonucleoside-triphosphate reductase activating protein [Candidatus Gracilibacteria bacterium]
MQISGIKKSTLLDFPGKVATIIFTPGCNFRCRFCHNSEFVLPEKMKENKVFEDLISEKAFFNFLESRIGLLDGVVICGGEPTLQKDLYDFAKKIKQMGFLVKLDTNGRDPEIVQKLINDKIIDFVAMDMKMPFSRFTELIGIEEKVDNYKKTAEILLNSNIDYEFRTTVIKNYHDKETIEEIAKDIEGAKNYHLQNFIGGNTLEPDFDGATFSKPELKEFMEVAKPYVQKCTIRT